MKRLFVWLSTKDLPEGWIINRFNDLQEIQCIKLQRQQDFGDLYPFFTSLNPPEISRIEKKVAIYIYIAM